MSSKVVVVAHGLSEVDFCRYVSDVTKVDICVYSRERGHRAIQINDIPSLMSDYPFDSLGSLKSMFPSLEYVPRVERKSFSENRSEMPRLTIFSIMDTDDSILLVKSYMAGEMTRKLPLGESIVPVYNVRNLDDVFGRYGADIDANNKARSYRKVLKGLDLRDFHRFLVEDGGTNLDEFVGHSLSRSPRMAPAS